MNTHYKGLLFLWVSILLFASANSVIDKLGKLGASHLINGDNPISFCNLLFAGNLIAGFVFLIVYHKKWRPHTFQQLNGRQWCSLTIVTLCSTILGPAFYILAIISTEVINVILISNTEIAWALILGYLIFDEKPTPYTLLGAFLAVVGVTLTFFLYHGKPAPINTAMMQSGQGTHWLTGFMAKTPKIGEITAALGAFFTMLGDYLTKKYIVEIPDYVYTTFRTFMGAILFFILAMILFGWSHFTDLFSPFLWEWMLVYGGVIVALAVYTFTQAVQIVHSNSIAIANAFFPVASVIFAYLIVGEIPQGAQIIGGIVIPLGIGFGLYDNLRQPKPITLGKEKIMGFKGI